MGAEEDSGVLVRHIGELEGLWVRVRFLANVRDRITHADGFCRGVQDDCIVLGPLSSDQDAVRIPLLEVMMVTQIPTPGKKEGHND